MNTELSIAKYLVALATNTLNDNIRSDYLSTFDTESETVINKSARNLFTTIFNNIGSADVYDVDSATALIKNEYNYFGFESVLGNFSQIEELITTLVNLKYNGYDAANVLDILKNLVEVVDKCETESIKTDVYLTVLNILVKKNLVLTDIEFTTEVNSYVDEHPAATNRLFYNIILNIIK